MSTSAFSYRRYLPDTPEAEPWGVAVTAGGRQVVAPGAAYPPPGHPPDHALTWTKGRVLGACQVVFITGGRGRFEAAGVGLRSVEAGTALVLLPGVWHRYAPDPASGWTEHWVELRGPVVERLIARRVLRAEEAVATVDRPRELEALFDSIHARLAGAGVRAHDPERGAVGLQVLALVAAARPAPEGRRTARLVAQAERLLAEGVTGAPVMPDIARRLGMAYSHFRREFRRRTGLSPQRYYNQVRLERARRLLGAGDRSLKEIAEQLGFSSAYHFSWAFKRHFGLAPGLWRRRSAAARPGTTP
jgi:AraC-like DNA-binding protein